MNNSFPISNLKRILKKSMSSVKTTKSRTAERVTYGQSIKTFIMSDPVARTGYNWKQSSAGKIIATDIQDADPVYKTHVDHLLANGLLVTIPFAKAIEKVQKKRTEHICTLYIPTDGRHKSLSRCSIRRTAIPGILEKSIIPEDHYVKWVKKLDKRTTDSYAIITKMMSILRGFG